MSPPICRVLLVEDEDLVAMLTEEMLVALGYEIGATVATLAAGLKVAAGGEFEVAILDINLRGVQSFPIADILLKRGIPFLFANGYTTQGIAPQFRSIPTLQKPFSIQALNETLKLSLVTRPQN